MKDVNGKELEEGCRVSADGRIPGKPWDAVPKDYEGHTGPRVSGRILKITEHPRGPVARIREFNTCSIHDIPLHLCKRQYGLHQTEKDLTLAEQRNLRLR